MILIELSETLFFILQYLDSICNVPSGLPFIDLDTRPTELSAALVVLAKVAAAYASGFNFIPEIGVITLDPNKDLKSSLEAMCFLYPFL